MTAGTVLQDTKLGLRTWVFAFFLVVTTKKGVSSGELARKLGVSDRTAWHVTLRILEAVERAERGPLGHRVEAWIGEVRNPRERRRYAGREARELVLALVGLRGGRPRSLVLVPVGADDRDVGLGVGAVHLVEDGSLAWGRRRGSRRSTAELVVVNLRHVLEGTHTRFAPGRFHLYAGLFAFRFDHREQLARGLLSAFAGAMVTPPRPFPRLVRDGSAPEGAPFF